MKKAMTGRNMAVLLATLNVFDGADGEHSVEIEVLAEQPERKLLKKEIDTACEKYDGTWFQPCQIMLIGDIVRQTPAASKSRF